MSTQTDGAASGLSEGAGAVGGAVGGGPLALGGALSALQSMALGAAQGGAGVSGAAAGVSIPDQPYPLSDSGGGSGNSGSGNPGSGESGAPPAEAEPGYIPASGANQSIESRINAARAIHQLPETDGLTDQQKADLYSRMFLDSTSPDGRAAYQSGDRAIFGMRIETDVNANGGRGRFDDRVVVLSLREDGTPALHYEGAFNTEPAGSYQEAGPFFGFGQGNPHPEGVDANGDGLRDLGRLPEGTYAYAWDHSQGFGPNVQGNYNVMRPVDPIDVERDVNRDGWFDAQDAAAVTNHNALDSGRSVLFHRGYPNFTGSAGCQTFPNNQFAGFAAALPASPQTWYPYTLTRM